MGSKTALLQQPGNCTNAKPGVSCCASSDILNNYNDPLMNGIGIAFALSLLTGIPVIHFAFRKAFNEVRCVFVQWMCLNARPRRLYGMERK